MFEHFTHQIIRRATAVFGTLFNNVKIKRYDDTGNTTETMTVPLRYAPKNKWYARVFEERQDSVSGPDYAIKSPSMGFEMTSMLYDTSRKLNRLNQIRNGSINTGQVQGYIGAPYTMSFQLYVFANKTADWTQIIEQIIPNFNPTLNIPVKMIHNDENDESIIQDVHITLTSVAPDQNMYGDFRQRQTYTWTLSFDMNISFYGKYGSPDSAIGYDDEETPNAGIIINFYNDITGDLTLAPGQEPIDIIEVPEI